MINSQQNGANGNSYSMQFERTEEILSVLDLFPYDKSFEGQTQFLGVC